MATVRGLAWVVVGLAILGSPEPCGTQGPAGPAAHLGIPVCRGRPGGTCSTTDVQTCAYDSDCPSGETCLGPAPRFVDNGNGTVTDRRTCLVWERKTGTVGTLVECTGAGLCPDPHDVNNAYSWSMGPPWNFDGTAAAVFLKQLNDSAFAGHTDWRLPTTAGPDPGSTGNDPELESILLAPSPCGGASPCIDTRAFGPTAAYLYWSASDHATGPESVWYIPFQSGGWGALGKNNYGHVRAVRRF